MFPTLENMWYQKSRYQTISEILYLLKSHRMMESESFQLGKTSKVIEFNCDPNTVMLSIVFN